MMIIDLINKGSILCFGSNDNTSKWVSLSDIPFTFMLAKHIVCNICGLGSPSFEFSCVSYITPTQTSPMQEIIIQLEKH